jgi:hypothetical protein
LAVDHLFDYHEGCNAGSVSFQINRPNGPICQNGPPRLIISDGSTMIITPARQSFENKRPIAIEECLDQVDCSLGEALNLVGMSPFLIKR